MTVHRDESMMPRCFGHDDSKLKCIKRFIGNRHYSIIIREWIWYTMCVCFFVSSWVAESDTIGYNTTYATHYIFGAGKWLVPDLMASPTPRGQVKILRETEETIRNEHWSATFDKDKDMALLGHSLAFRGSW